jgi:hypothetical protein
MTFSAFAQILRCSAQFWCFQHYHFPFEMKFPSFHRLPNLNPSPIFRQIQAPDNQKYDPENGQKFSEISGI